MKCALVVLAACGHADPSPPVVVVAHDAAPVVHDAAPVIADAAVASSGLPPLIAKLFEPGASWRFRVVTTTHTYDHDKTTTSPTTEGTCEVAEVKRYKKRTASRVQCHGLGKAPPFEEVWLADQHGLWGTTSDVLPSKEPRGDDVWLELANPPVELDKSRQVNEGFETTTVRKDGDAWCWLSGANGLGSGWSEEICVDEAGFAGGTSIDGNDDADVTVTFTRE